MDGLMGGWIDGIRRRVRRPDKNEEVVNEVQSRRTWTCPEMSADHSNSNCRQWFPRMEHNEATKMSDVEEYYLPPDRTLTQPPKLQTKACRHILCIWVSCASVVFDYKLHWHSSYNSFV